jgi:ERF superfamily protein
MPEPCKTLAEALAALQARLPRVAKTADAQYGKYADLTVVSDALLPIMASLGLSFSAKPTLLGDKFVLHYILRHTSGEADDGFYPLPISGTPQQVGSAITYARRYTLCAVTGLAPGGDDDDAQAAEAEHRGRPDLPDLSTSGRRLSRAVPDSQLAGEGRMTRGAKSAHERLAKETVSGGRAERSRPRGPDPDDPWAQDAPVDGQRAAAVREDTENTPGSSNAAQWQQLAILYSQIGLTERDTRLAEMTDRCGREITSAKDLSYAEAEQAIRGLRDLAKTYQQEAAAGGTD